MEAVEIGLRTAIESLIAGLVHAGVLDDAGLAKVLASLSDGASSVRGSIPYSGEIIDALMGNAEFIARRPPL